MKIVNGLRILALGSAIALPVGIYSCHKLTEKPAIVKAIDEEREALEKKECEFSKLLHGWANQVKNGVNIDNLEEPFVKLDLAYKKFRDLVEPPKNFIDRINETTGTTIIPNVISTGSVFDFWVKPTHEQVKAFINRIIMADKAALVKKNAPDKFMKTAIEEHNELTDELAPKKLKLIQEIEVFNKKAQAAGQAPYEPRWGLSPELLKSLKSIDKKE